MPPTPTANDPAKKKRAPKNPYTITPEEGFNFTNGKTVPFKGWRVTFNAARGEKKVSVILYEESLTHELLDSVLKSHTGNDTATA